MCKINETAATISDVVKKGLGSNYFFHKNVTTLSVEVILNYFETNYMGYLHSRVGIQP